MTVNSAHPVVFEPCLLAEGPLWHPGRARIYWTDILAGKLFWHDPASGEHQCFHSGETVGGFTFNHDGSLVLFRVKDVCWIDFEGNIRAIQPVALGGMQRFNDVIAAPDGSVFAGTIGRTAESGGLYHFRPDGTVSRLFSGTGCSNGMGFSPDQTVFYWTCSTSRRIYAFDYKGGELAVAGRRLFYEAQPEEGIPDGLTVDQYGTIWSAQWDGFQFVQIDPSGKKLGAVPVPRARVSSLCFGGPRLDSLYITVAAADGPEENGDQSLFRWEAGTVRGREEFFSGLDSSHGFRIEDS
jgi:D-xylonolactonase